MCAVALLSILQVCFTARPTPSRWFTLPSSHGELFGDCTQSRLQAASFLASYTCNEYPGIVASSAYMALKPAKPVQQCYCHVLLLTLTACSGAADRNSRGCCCYYSPAAG